MNEAGELLDAITLPAYAGLGLSQVSVIANSAQAAVARAALERADVLGFDTESRPTFVRGQASSGPHLVQLATDHHCYLYQVDHLDAFDELNALLASPRLVKAGFGLGDDLRRLASKCGIVCAGTVDLAQRLRAVGNGRIGRNAVGVKTAVADLLGQQLQKSKKVATTNWASRVLSERQILYAANDAHAALRVYRAWLAHTGVDRS